MKIAELILEYIGVLIYPVLLLVVFIALQKQIRNLLERITAAKWGSVSIEIGIQGREDQNRILDHIKNNGGSLPLKELYREAEKLPKHTGHEET